MDFTDYTPYLTINGASQHMPDSKFPNAHWNQENSGFGLKFKNPTQDGLLRSLIIGQYNNSINRPSTYGAAVFGKRLLGNDNFNLGASVRTGLVTGYNDSVVPMVQPLLTAGLGPVDINLGMIPRIAGFTPRVFTLNTDIKLPDF